MALSDFFQIFFLLHRDKFTSELCLFKKTLETRCTNSLIACVSDDQVRKIRSNNRKNLSDFKGLDLHRIC